MAQKDIKGRIASVQNIQKITRAMEMVAAARLRRAEQRISALRPYAESIRRLTRQASQAAEQMPSLEVLKEHDSVERVGILFVTGDRGLAGSFNSQILRAGLRAAEEYAEDGVDVAYYASGKRGVSSLVFRGHDPDGRYVGFTDRPTYGDARDIAEELIAAYTDGKVDRVEIFYNGYISALSQVVRRETLLPLQHATVVGADDEEQSLEEAGEGSTEHPHAAAVSYEPDPEAILSRLIPDYVEISIYRALLESTASEHGARMTAMRSASTNAGELIDSYKLAMNRARQAEITQEIMEVVAGAEALS